MSTDSDRVLDALDSLGEVTFVRLLAGGRMTWAIEGDSRSFESVQGLSEVLGCSDTKARKVIRNLIDDGLVEAHHVVGKNGVRRILVTGEAR